MNRSARERRLPGDTVEIGPACLVTGASGFLGRALVNALIDRGCMVHALDTRPFPGTHGLLREYTGDIRDFGTVAEAARGCATVFHAAAVMNFLGICDAATRREVRGVNVDGTKNVIRACRDAGVARLVYTSTDSVCHRREPLAGGDESLPYAARCLDIYAETKIEAERAVLGADGMGGLRTIALRPAGLWGHDDDCYMMAKLLEELRRGSFVAVIGDGTSLADNTHVDNLVRAEILAAESLVHGPGVTGGRAYFITDEEPMNLVEWFRPLIEGLGYEVPRRALPARLMYGLAFMMECLHRIGGPRPFLTRLEVHNLTTDFTFSCAGARRDLGYRPSIGRDEGMRLCVERFRDRYSRKADVGR